MTPGAARTRYANMDSGEMYLAEKERRVKHQFDRAEDGTYYMLLSTAYLRRIRRSGYHGSVLTVLLYALETMNQLGQVTQRQQKIVEETEISKASVSRAVGQLVADGWMYYDEFDILCVNIKLAFMGTGAAHKEVVERMPERLRYTIPRDNVVPLPVG